MNDTLTTPRGKFIWPHLTTPNTQFDENGVYEVRLQFELEPNKSFLDKLSHVFDRGYEDLCSTKNKKIKIRDYLKTHSDDERNPIPEGHGELKFKMKASGTNNGESWTQRPALFDSQGNVMNKILEESGDKIGSGSIGKISFQPKFYFVASVGAGLTLRLKAAQILKMVTYSGGGSDISKFGFEKTDGFTIDEPKDTEDGSEYDFI